MSAAAPYARHLPLALLLAALVAIPFLCGGYTLYRFSLAWALAIAVLGLTLLTGLNGQLSVGHSAFFAVGAFLTAMVMRDWGLSAYLALPVAGVGAFVTGFLFGLPAVRLGLVHLALATWGLSLALPQFLKWSVIAPWTGGVQGLYLERPHAPFGLPLSDDQWWYVVCAVALVVMLLPALNLSRGRIGRALMAVRDNELAAAPAGINVTLYKATIFGISALYAGVAGGLAGLRTDFIGPDTYGLFFSIQLLVGAVAGGLHSVWGAVFGGLLIQFLPDLAADASGIMSFPAYGLILIALVYLLPSGFAGALQRAGSWAAARLRR